MGFTLHTDGGSRGNPGIAACGFDLLDGDEVVLSGGWYLGETTNNQAEYSGLIWGLTNALEEGVRTLDIRLDSDLLVRQVKGEYKVKNAALKPLFAQVKDLLGRFDSYSIEHVYREKNTVSDARVNEAMDAADAVGDYLVDFEGGAGQGALF